MKKQKYTIVVVLALVAIVLLAAYYMNRHDKNYEGYRRSCLAGDCYGLQRTPVDYAQKYPNGWQRNPHWKSNPADLHQPLDYGPIDFYSDNRRLNENGGVLFQQYRQDWPGCGKDLKTLANDEKNRFDLENIGAHGARVQLDNLYNPRFGNGIRNTEIDWDEPNPFYDKIYGGSGYLLHDKIGDNLP